MNYSRLSAGGIAPEADLELSNQLNVILRASKDGLSEHAPTITYELCDVISALMALSRMRNICSEQQHVGQLMEGSLDVLSDIVLRHSKELSTRAAANEAVSFKDLASKAKIWLERYIPEPGDDVGELGVSICQDVLKLVEGTPKP